MLLAVAEEVPSQDGKKSIRNPYKKWNQIDSALPDWEIISYGPPTSSGTRDAFEVTGVIKMYTETSTNNRHSGLPGNLAEVNSTTAHNTENHHTDERPEIKVEVADLSLYYGDNQALHNINMAIFKNNITALIGPSGCGKSTFLFSLK